ncbi:hypothetical protein RCJOLI_47 [Rhodobacter phage RcJoli]|nr:hypothetical protein RCJOLI_47 [Rhodobacter phage RcJoli]
MKKLNNFALATLICIGMILAWHILPIPTPQIIPLDQQPSAPIDAPLEPADEPAVPPAVDTCE